MLPNIEEAIEFLNRIGFPRQLVSIVPDGTTSAAYFQEPEPARKWIAEHNKTANIYFTLNELGSSFNKKPKKSDIVAMKAAHADLDPAENEDSETGKRRHLAALRQMSPLPSAVIDSGNGVQALWLLREPVPVNGNVDVLESINRALGPTCWNIDRLLRVPGTANRPNEKKKKIGRVPVLSKLIYFGERVYELADFPRAATAVQSTPNGAAPDLPEELPQIGSLDDVAELSGNEWLRGLIETGEDPGRLPPFPSRSEAVYAAVHGMIRAGCSDSVIATVLLSPQFGIGESIREKPAPRQEAERQINHARGKAAKAPPAAARAAESSAAPQWPVLDPAARHGFMGQLLDVLEPHTEADPAMIAVQLLVGVGAAFGRSPHFMVGATRHGCNLNAVGVGDSSKARKGTSLDHNQQLIGSADPTMPEPASGLSSGEGLMFEVRDTVRKRSPIKNKGRVAGYQDVIEDEGVNDKRLLILEEEFASVLTVMTREGNTLSSLIRRAWDGRNLRSMVKKVRSA
jgi:hypothetical protein